MPLFFSSKHRGFSLNFGSNAEEALIWAKRGVISQNPISFSKRYSKQTKNMYFMNFGQILVPGPGSQIDCFHICIQEEAGGPIESEEIVSGVPIGQGALLCHTRGPGQPSGLRRTHLGTGTGHTCSKNLVSLELCLPMAVQEAEAWKCVIPDCSRKQDRFIMNKQYCKYNRSLPRTRYNYLIYSYYLTLSINHYCLPHEQWTLHLWSI